MPVGNAQPAASLRVLAARFLSPLAGAVAGTVGACQAAVVGGGIGVGGRVRGLGQAHHPGAEVGVRRPGALPPASTMSAGRLTGDPVKPSVRGAGPMHKGRSEHGADERRWRRSPNLAA